MPYLYLKSESESEGMVGPLTRFLSLSGVNLTKEPTARADAVGIIFYRGSPSVRFRPAAIRFARSLANVFRCVAPSTVLRQDTSLPFFSVPTAIVRLPESISDDTAARLITRAVSLYFVLPELEDRPERPARIGALQEPMRTVADERAKILQVIGADTPVTCLGSNGKWSVVRHADELGFCRTSRLRFT